MFFRPGIRRFFNTAAALCLFVIVPTWIIAAAPGPLAVIQTGTERALGILRSSHNGEGPALRQRKGEILAVVDEYFNFEEMARRALGRPWKEQPAEKRQEFVRLFRQLLFDTYITRVEKYTGSNEKIMYDPERIDGNLATVRTRVTTTKDNQTYQIDYRLQQEGGQWKVYDVIVEGVSFVDNYRSQFASILANESFDSLLRKMREKVNAASRS